MSKRNCAQLLFVSFLLWGVAPTIEGKISGKSANGDIEYTFSAGLKIETFYGSRISLLNRTLQADKLWFARHTLDTKLNILYGAATYSSPVVECNFSIRNKGVWGNAESIARTTECKSKILDSVGGEHRHAIPRHIFWMREAWMEGQLESMIFGCDMPTKHRIKLGLFPFTLGNAIALGDAYSVSSDLLGFYTDSVVDQYAPGLLLHGDLVQDVLEYDIYAAVLNNRASSLSETGSRILGQQFGKRNSPERGFGSINYLVAGRLNWYVFNNDTYGSLRLEPYGLFNNDPEQKVQFLADATSRLGTLGLAVEYIHDRVEFGFEYALNVGNQKVKGWDRNEIGFAVDKATGFVKQVNSHVVDQNGDAIVFNQVSTVGKQVQAIINQSIQDEKQNGHIVGSVGGVDLINASNRFRNGYTNKFDGWMFVADGIVWAYKKDVQLAFAVGVASGDANPNEETIDGEYGGFIGLQEIYSGNRVNSAFLFGGAGKLNRPLSQPSTDQAPNRFSSNSSGFSNIIFTGSGFTWEPQERKKPFSLNGNILGYWQEYSTNKFDSVQKKQLNDKASTFLGIETNIFAHYYILKDIKLVFVGSVFLPGTHFRDIRGKPLNADQARALDRFDTTADVVNVPNISNDTAYTFNFGVDFRF